MLEPSLKTFFRRIAANRAGDPSPCRGATAGTTFVEIMIAMAVFVGGTVSIMGGVMSLSTHRHAADTRAQATSFASSAFENVRGLGINAILAYDVPVDDAENSTVDLPGVGPVAVALFAVIPAGGGVAQSQFELGVDDVAGINVASLPNPIEIRAVMSPYRAGGDGYAQMQFTAATLINY